MHIYNELKSDNVSIEKIEEDKKKLESKISEITRRNPKNRNKDQSDTIENIRNLYNSRKKTVKLYNDHAKITSEAMCKTKQGKGLKILTPKHMLQSLTVALAQVKADNNSQSLLNEIKQIVTLCINQKKLLKKYTIT